MGFVDEFLYCFYLDLENFSGMFVVYIDVVWDLVV